MSAQLTHPHAHIHTLKRNLNFLLAEAINTTSNMANFKCNLGELKYHFDDIAPSCRNVTSTPLIR